jgi:hypothetical protein
MRVLSTVGSSLIRLPGAIGFIAAIFILAITAKITWGVYHQRQWTFISRLALLIVVAASGVSFAAGSIVEFMHVRDAALFRTGLFTVMPSAALWTIGYWIYAIARAQPPQK